MQGLVLNRIDINPSARPLAIPGRVLNELRNHAVQAEPEECCGLVTGNAARRFRTVHRCRNVIGELHQRLPDLYPRGDAREAFAIDVGDLIRIQREAGEQGDEVTAVYHSHPGAGAYLSPEDQRHISDPSDPGFVFARVTQIVLAVFDGKADPVGAFQWDPERGRFEGRLVVEAER